MEKVEENKQQEVKDKIRTAEKREKVEEVERSGEQDGEGGGVGCG